MNNNILDKVVWSYSSLHLYEQCPYAFYLNKIEKREEIENFYSTNGSIIHEIFANILNGVISVDEAPTAYAEAIDFMIDFDSDNTNQKIYENCINYLCEVEPLPSKYEVLGVELKLEYKINNYSFIGFADAVLKNKDTGEIWLIDHKSSNHFLKKDGKPLKNQEENFYSYRNQMYIYCMGLKDNLGIQVDKICWHHFKDNGKTTIIPFKSEECEETKQWALNLIENIYKDNEFLCNKSYSMCHMLCDYRDNCEYLFEEEEEEF